ncbi:MAG: chromosome partitioning protein ParA [Pseudomonadales bacterium]
MQPEHTDVVLFFENHEISKEMLLAEFEAVLDHVVSVPEFEDQTVEAAFVRVNENLHATAIVFFKIAFVRGGGADPKWNVPLEHMASNSSTGPDLGAGKIRLACYSQCPVAWHQKQLWDPAMSPGHNTFMQIRIALVNNRLGLTHVPAALAPEGTSGNPQALPSLGMDQAVSVPQKKFGAEAQVLSAEQTAERKRIAEHIKSQRLHIATLKNKRNEDIAKLKSEFQKQLRHHQQTAQQLERQCQEQTERADRFKTLLQEQVRNIKQERERAAAQLSEARTQDVGEQFDILQQKFDLELQAKIGAETAELKEMLEMRNVELFYREEQMTALRDEIANLRQEKVRLLNQGANSYLEQLSEAGVDFVAHHPGAGHLSISAADVGEYLDSPQRFAAKKCYVDSELYGVWLEHYNDPVCQADVDVSGEGDSFPCGRSLERVEIPNQYVANFSNRCPEHQNQATFVDAQAGNDDKQESQQCEPIPIQRGA